MASSSGRETTYDAASSYGAGARGDSRAPLQRRTEDAYVHWIRRFIVFHSRRHPRELAAAEIAAFITWLTVDQHVAASTQNQALSGILFFYKRTRIAV